MTDCTSRYCVNKAHEDNERELLRAAEQIPKLEARIVFLEKALKQILDAPCDAHGQILVSACPCCLHDRMIARAALAGIE